MKFGNVQLLRHEIGKKLNFCLIQSILYFLNYKEDVSSLHIYTLVNNVFSPLKFIFSAKLYFYV